MSRNLVLKKLFVVSWVVKDFFLYIGRIYPDLNSRQLNHNTTSLLSYEMLNCIAKDPLMIFVGQNEFFFLGPRL